MENQKKKEEGFPWQIPALVAGAILAGAMVSTIPRTKEETKPNKPVPEAHGKPGIPEVCPLMTSFYAGKASPNGSLLLILTEPHYSAYKADYDKVRVRAPKLGYDRTWDLSKNSGGQLDLPAKKDPSSGDYVSRLPSVTPLEIYGIKDGVETLEYKGSMRTNVQVGRGIKARLRIGPEKKK